MIHRIRELAASFQGELTDDLRVAIQAQDAGLEDEDDSGLDLLVKNAVRENWLEHDPRRVWKELSERVRGPFGRIAVEEAALAGQSMPLAYESDDVNQQTPEQVRHRYFRFSDRVVPQC
jgi:hypothetical protein